MPGYPALMTEAHRLENQLACHERSTGRVEWLQRKDSNPAGVRFTLKIYGLSQLLKHNHGLLDLTLSLFFPGNFPDSSRREGRARHCHHSSRSKRSRNSILNSRA